MPSQLEKLRCQVVAYLTQEKNLYKVDPLCKLLGITRQGYYKHTEKTNEEYILISSVVWYCQYIRSLATFPRLAVVSFMSYVNNTLE